MQKRREMLINGDEKLQGRVSVSNPPRIDKAEQLYICKKKTPFGNPGGGCDARIIVVYSVTASQRSPVNQSCRALVFA